MKGNFDFEPLNTALSDLLDIVNHTEQNNHRELNPVYTQKNITDRCTVIKNELNKFFPDFTCNYVIYTENFDKPFFGLLVKPVYPIQFEHFAYAESLRDPMKSTTDPLNHITSYSVEIDSKLLLGYGYENQVTPNGLISLLLHDIDVMTSRETYDELIAVVNSIIVGLGIERSIKQTNTKFINSLFPYCLSETACRMFNSTLKTYVGVPIATEIICHYELSNDYDDIMEVVMNRMDMMERTNTCDTLCLNWFFYMAKDWVPGSTGIICTLKGALESTGSVLMKRMILSALEFLTGNNMTCYVEERSFLSKVKYNGMKSLEDDIYEYSMRVKNIDDENSAILLMRQLNSRMGIIEDYLEQEELSDTERKRWEKLYDKYDSVRNEMIKKPIYSRKMYGLFVDYNALMNMNAANQMTMNTMY